jgi:peptidoglycan/LPS O-acetylase OafA/YrhL
LKPFATNSPELRYIPTLDGWRAVAILLVLWAHQGNYFYATPEAYLRGGLFYFGTWGVPIFFGLSGLLITKLLLEENARTGRIDIKDFYTRRAFRILPPMFVYLAVVVAAGLLQSGREVWSSVFFYRNYLPWQLGSWYSGHLWSLSVEEHFYLFWPAMLVFLGVRKAWRTAIFLSLACAAWRWYMHAPIGDGRTDFRLDSLLLGAALAFALDSPALIRYVSPAAWLAIVGGILAAVHFDLRLICAGLIPLAIAGTVTHPAWPISRVLNWWPVRWIGRISYSLYLWQQLFLYPPWQPKPWGWPQLFPWSIAGTFACAAASYYFVERPMIRLGRRFSTSSRLRALGRA